VLFGQDAFAAQILQRPLQFVGKRLEHTLLDEDFRSTRKQA
jgi:hypothetical protein